MFGKAAAAFQEGIILHKFRATNLTLPRWVVGVTKTTVLTFRLWHFVWFHFEFGILTCVNPSQSYQRDLICLKKSVFSPGKPWPKGGAPELDELASRLSMAMAIPLVFTIVDPENTPTKTVLK